MEKMWRGRPKLTRDAVVKKDINLFNLTEHIALGRVEWQKMIHVADLT